MGSLCTRCGNRPRISKHSLAKYCKECKEEVRMLACVQHTIDQKRSRAERRPKKVGINPKWLTRGTISIDSGGGQNG